MKVSVVGCGWLGKPLALNLVPQHSVLGTTRSLEKAGDLQSHQIEMYELNHPHIIHPRLLEVDVIILNIPPFEGQLDWYRSWNLPKDLWVIFVSSTSVYVEAPSTLTEDAPLNQSLLSQEEHWIQSHFSDWTILRMGGLLGGSRHPGKFLAGRENIKNKNWPVNLIHQDDAVGFIETVLSQNLRREVFNVVSDEHHTREEFYTEYAKRKNLPGPKFDLRDDSQGKLISHEKMSKYYELKWPTLYGKDL